MSNWYSQDSFIELADNDIHIWLNYLNVHEARIKHLYPLLSSEEKQRSERLKFYKHRKAFIASHGFMHTVLANYIDAEANDIEFTQTELGKPSLIDTQNKNNIQFNLSHSGNLAILAVCRHHSVGIDTEHAERKVDWRGISKRFFTTNELQQLDELTEAEQKQAFFQIWTRKEAHMKVTGKGLSLAPTQFEVSVPPQDASFIKNLKNKDDNFYKMQDILLPEMFKDYYACLSADFDYTKITQFIHS
ncbi:MAG: 4'-phosphopantetheinyl transferase superfamily protein [Gammaproteobacteria bacterium]|nr:4'-phosphopantetheinyl transferase superfamily protein [Gammaproteobacteria bacterium]